ncbi:MAG: hypothetical protein WD046_14135 [Paracoccaceae bacterium]
MLNPTLYHRIFRASAWYDLLITWPFMTPLTLGWFWAMMGAGHALFGLQDMPALSVYAVLFGNFFGTVVIVWSLVRLKWNDIRLARYDAAARFLFSAWMLVALMNGASPLIWGFVLVELTWGVAQALGARKSGAQ